ncbi:hypothetical protein [Limobrevibacterium gyesilva]|uniref:Uncharacterized protein n=1 Tax=Limobrevibacterium gyesilva TaxID=2991712 RepID=A0AA41YLM1_9PROT|nr:hypothetical protein [Limobrevibacterium gyesilva]MCW3474208.1 hypothetical protein [Limobrevibacterium gyesilva]
MRIAAGCEVRPRAVAVADLHPDDGRDRTQQAFSLAIGVTPGVVGMSRRLSHIGSSTITLPAPGLRIVSRAGSAQVVSSACIPMVGLAEARHAMSMHFPQ